MTSMQMSHFAVELYIVELFLAEWIILTRGKIWSCMISTEINKAYSLQFLLQTAKSLL